MRKYFTTIHIYLRLKAWACYESGKKWFRPLYLEHDDVFIIHLFSAFNILIIKYLRNMKTKFKQRSNANAEVMHYQICTI